MSGCAICVNDLYIESKAAYQSALGDALDQLEAKKVPRDKWPESVASLYERRIAQASGAISSVVDEEPLDASMRAFLELERKLKGTS